MSGEGILPSQREEMGNCCAGELGDVIAYLAQRRDNAGAIARKSPEFADQARDRERQLEVMIDELRAGLHVGSAEVRARLMAGQEGGKGHGEAGD